MGAFLGGLAAVGLTVAALKWLVWALAKRAGRRPMSLDDELRLLLEAYAREAWRAEL